MEKESFGWKANTMKRIYMLVEGQTEETFVRELLHPYYFHQGKCITPIISRTSPGHKGGITSYGKVKHQLVRLCRQHHASTVTTMFDLYGLPNDFPGKNLPAYTAQVSGSLKAKYLEQMLSQDINEGNFIPNLMSHEFEAMLFVQPEKFSDWLDNNAVVPSLLQIANKFSSPEDINDSPHTAPSKRISALMPEYKKPLHGPLIAADIGLDAIRAACPHFNNWLTELDNL